MNSQFYSDDKASIEQHVRCLSQRGHSLEQIMFMIYELSSKRIAISLPTYERWAREWKISMPTQRRRRNPSKEDVTRIRPLFEEYYRSGYSFSKIVFLLHDRGLDVREQTCKRWRHKWGLGPRNNSQRSGTCGLFPRLSQIPTQSSSESPDYTDVGGYSIGSDLRDLTPGSNISSFHEEQASQALDTISSQYSDEGGFSLDQQLDTLGAAHDLDAYSPILSHGNGFTLDAEVYQDFVISDYLNGTYFGHITG